jgi:hypothetical protein
MIMALPFMAVNTAVSLNLSLSDAKADFALLAVIFIQSVALLLWHIN